MLASSDVLVMASKCLECIVPFFSILAVNVVADSHPSSANFQDADEVHFIQKHVESWIQPAESDKKYGEIHQRTIHSNRIDLHTMEATNPSTLSTEVASTKQSTNSNRTKRNAANSIRVISPSHLFVQFTSPRESDDLKQSEQPLCSVKELPGCPACDLQSHETCGRCIRLGSQQDTGQGSRLFEVHNVLMVNGTALWIGEHADKISKCGEICNPTWEQWPRGGYSWSEYDGAPLNLDHTDLHSTSKTESCTPERMITQPALITNWFFPNNVYHFFMQNVFPTFMTLAHLAGMQDCKEELIEVYVNSGWSTSTHFKPLWDAFAKRSGPMTDMNGCYRQVFFGQMAEDYLKVGAWNTYAPILSTWMTAYRINARSLLVGDVSTSRAAPDSFLFLYVAHNRAPPWTKNINWSVKGVEIRPIDFAKLPIHAQFAHAAKANGFIGVAGSGIAQQIFLPVGSSVLQLTTLQAWDESDLLGQGDCVTIMDDPGTIPQPEQTTRCYGNTAIHIGISLLNWRWCRPNLLNDSAAFSSQDAQAVVKLLLSETQVAQASETAFLCTVLNDRTLVKPWPRCDSLVVAPILQPSRRCGKYGIVGTPFSPQENQTVMWYCTSASHCY